MVKAREGLALEPQLSPRVCVSPYRRGILRAGSICQYGQHPPGHGEKLHLLSPHLPVTTSHIVPKPGCQKFSKIITSTAGQNVHLQLPPALPCKIKAPKSQSPASAKQSAVSPLPKSDLLPTASRNTWASLQAHPDAPLL